ncbi:MAG TPA: glycoside hydrolase family 18 protein [Chitinophagaceae bacterium]|nr:glycoside hydrolase family 18 protein [Chitinophagaceae bacterium]
MNCRILLLAMISIIGLHSTAQKTSSKKPIAVIAYYAGRTTMIDSFEVEKLTHLIFCFCHLKGNKLSVGNARDSATIQRMVALKSRNPGLKIILSLGGWGGCQTCSPVFITKKGRREFARSVRDLNNYFGTDGIDLDWEYPAIEGFPGHAYSPEDKPAFTMLVKQLRRKLGKKNEISFAAGGFAKFIDSSLEWKKVMKKVDRVNLMSYDLVSGFSMVSGHHTPLYSTPHQKESTDNGVQMMLGAGVPAGKIVIGAAFYGRLFEVTDTVNNGLYLPGKFAHGFSFSRIGDSLSTANGFVQYWDSIAHAPYAFNIQRRLLATYDDSVSVQLKAKYVIKNNLNGIMFWQLADDKFSDGLLNAIDKIKKEE